MWTPSVTPTINPNSPRILELLNEEFLSDDLETTLNARYEAVDVWFSNFSSGLPPMFHLKIRCECPINGHCCVPEYMFVLTIRAIKNRADELIPQVPYDVIQLNVECYHGLELLDMFFVSWSDVNAYIENSIDGHMLGMRVMSTPFTTP